MDDCIFCKLANHDIPTTIVYETDTVCAFEDANPQAPVHVLVVPKRHYAHVADDVPREVLADIMEAAIEVARIKGVDQSGFRLVMNTGADANQIVKHLHCHVLGGKRLRD